MNHSSNYSMNFIAAKADEGKWLSLIQHLKDTRDVMEQLLKEYIPPSVYTASGLSRDEFEQIALFVAYSHDIGKSTNAFQKKMCDALPGYINILGEHGISIKSGGMDDKSPHALAGAVILEHYFNINPDVCEIIASHHGKPPDMGKSSNSDYQIKMYPDNYYSESSYDAYKAVWVEIVNMAGDADIVKVKKKISVEAKMLLTGLLIMADWIASCSDFFPLAEIYGNSFETDRVTKGMNALKLQPFQDFSLSYMSGNEFEKRFQFKPNKMQDKICSISNNIITPGIMIIEAPMGQGKTEAALSAAEVLSCAAGTGGVFFGLPTRNTANSMFVRVKEWAETLSQDRGSSISLSHSSAGFNESYEELRTKVYDEKNDGLTVNAWMTGKYKKLLPNYITGTVDQALFTVLKRKFLMLLHLGMAGKTVIIDEVHSYDDYMMEYLKTLLSWLGAYKVPVILLSATLTQERRDEFIYAYTGHEGYDRNDSYPCVTWSDGDNIISEPLILEETSGKMVSIKSAVEEKISVMIQDILSDGGCAGVICDTVRHAQDIYEKLKSEIGEEYRIQLLHSRFLPMDRVVHERDIINEVGKNSTVRNKIVVVGTQVLEQSLDIDFDVLFTEKCPIDLLFQRIGRLHRHYRAKRPEKVKNAVCYLFDDESQKAAEAVYDRYILRRTDEVLSKKNVLMIPDDIRSLTEAVYDMASGSDGDDKDAYLKKREELKMQSKAYLLPDAPMCKWKGMLLEANAGNGSGTVRYGLNNMDLILLKKNGEDYVTFSGEKFNGSIMPDEAGIKELLSNRISLQYSDELFDAQEEMELWKKNCYLEAEYFLSGDSKGIFKVGKNTYKYTKDLGWRRL